MLLVIFLLTILVGSVPAGFAAAAAARKLASTTRQPRIWVMVIASAALGIWAALLVPAVPLLVMTCVLGWGLLVLSTVDALAFRLPDSLTLPLIAAGIGTSLLLPEPDPVGHVIAAIAGIAIFYGVAVGYRALRGRDGLGLGDAKLAGAAGAWLGWQALPSVVLLACCAGLVWIGVATIRRGKAALGERIPFGVALSFAIWLIWLYGPPTWPDTQP